MMDEIEENMNDNDGQHGVTGRDKVEREMRFGRRKNNGGYEGRRRTKVEQMSTMKDKEIANNIKD